MSREDILLFAAVTSCVKQKQVKAQSLKAVPNEDDGAFSLREVESEQISHNCIERFAKRVIW